MGLDELFGMFTERATAYGAELMQWVSSVQRNGLVKWAPVMAARLPCSCFRHAPGGGVMRCPKTALAPCLVCREVVCLEHAVIAPNADVCCVRCIDAMAERSLREQAQGAPPPWYTRDPRPARGAPPPADPPGVHEAERERCLRLLGLERGASAEELHRVFRRVSAKLHPDRHPEHKRAAAEQKYKKVSAAYAFLKDHGTGQAAA